MRRAVSRKCPKCRAAVLRGLDGDLAAQEAVVDQIPVLAAAEPVARLLGLRTYTLRAGRLDYRNRWQLASPPPFVNDRLVVEHRCGGVGVDFLPAPPIPSTAFTDTEEPPY